MLRSFAAIIMIFSLMAPISGNSLAHAKEYPSAGERYRGIIAAECKLDKGVLLYQKAAKGAGPYFWVLTNPALGEKFNCLVRGLRTYGLDSYIAPYGQWRVVKEGELSCYDRIDFSGWPGGQRIDCDEMSVTLQMARLDGILINIYAEMDMLRIDKIYVEQAQLAFQTYSDKICAIASRTESAPSAESNGLHCMAELVSAHTDMLLANPVELMVKDAMNSKEQVK